MKKVLLTINNNRLSGIEKFTILLAEYMNKNEYKVTVAVPTDGPLCDTLKENNIEYIIFNNKINEKHTLSGILFLFKHIYREKYDIIHAQAGIAPCLIGTLLGTKLVLEHKHGLDFTSEQIENMSFLKLNYEKLKKYFTDFTITGCETDKSTLVKKFNYNPDKVRVVYNGIEKNSSDTEFGRAPKFSVGTIGRLTFQKGQEYFIGMAKILKDKGYDFEFYIYGDGEKRKDYDDLIKKYKLENSVFLMGYAKDIPAAMKSFDVFVLPSRYEGIPYVILEAMKANVPVITTDVGGVSEIINDNVNGILVKKENENELAERTILLYNSKDLREKLTQNARKDFEEKYTIEKTIRCIETIYAT